MSWYTFCSLSPGNIWGANGDGIVWAFLAGSPAGQPVAQPDMYSGDEACCIMGWAMGVGKWGFLSSESPPGKPVAQRVDRPRVDEVCCALVGAQDWGGQGGVLKCGVQGGE